MALFDEGHDAANQRLNASQRFNPIPLRIRLRAPTLERLLDHDPQIRDGQLAVIRMLDNLDVLK